jgi:hypothetical protein
MNVEIQSRSEDDEDDDIRLYDTMQLTTRRNRKIVKRIVNSSYIRERSRRMSRAMIVPLVDRSRIALEGKQ